MSSPKPSPKESYSESEAAAALAISIDRLHQLLDEHIFTEGRVRPASLEFTASDLLLLTYWNSDNQQTPGRSQVLQMPKRK